MEEQKEQDEIVLGIGELAVKHNPVILSAVGLGSCVGIILYDATAHIGGLAHVMLPESKTMTIPKERVGESYMNKYADIAIPRMIEDMVKLGAKKENIHAKIVGGAQMFPNLKNDNCNIGNKNIDATRKTLQENNIPIDAEDLGGNQGRSVRFDTKTQKVLVKTLNKQKEI